MVFRIVSYGYFNKTSKYLTKYDFRDHESQQEKHTKMKWF